jgi:heptosyltransferase I
LSHLPFVDEVITHERERWRDYPALFRRLAARRYDVVVDGLVLRPSVNSYTTLLMLASKARWRVGSGGRPHDGVYNVPVAPPRNVYREHHVQHLARLAEPLGVGPGDADWRPSLVVTTLEREAARARWAAAAGYGPRILVNISAGHPCRRWPDDRFAIALRELRARTPDARIVVVALEQDLMSAAYLAGSIGGGAGAPSLRELIALVAEADLVVTPDTAVAHIASAFARPTLALMRRRAEAEMWVPYRTPGVNVFGPTDASLADLPTSAVVDVLDEALSLAASGADRPRVALRLPA